MRELKHLFQSSFCLTWFVERAGRCLGLGKAPLPLLLCFFTKLNLLFEEQEEISIKTKIRPKKQGIREAIELGKKIKGSLSIYTRF